MISSVSRSSFVRLARIEPCLKELEENGLVTRVQYNEIPPRVEYSLTPRSESLLPALRHLYTWGEEQIRLEEQSEG